MNTPEGSNVLSLEIPPILPTDGLRLSMHERAEKTIKLKIPEVLAQFSLIVKVYESEISRPKKMEAIRKEIESNPVLGKVIDRHPENWKKLSNPIIWGYPELILPELKKMITYHTSPDRPGLRDGFDEDYFRLLTYITELHEEMLPPQDPLALQGIYRARR